MNGINEMKAKLDMAAQGYADRNAKAEAGCCIGEAKMAPDPERPSLARRVRDQLQQAEAATRKAQYLGELQYLLEKNPEVARILDLMEHVMAWRGISHG